MKVLVVTSGNSGNASVFIQEQINELRRLGVQAELFLIRGKGIRGYLSNRKPLDNCVINGRYDLIHAHYGLSGMVAVLQKKVPVIITYHGSDVAGHPWQNLVSSLAGMKASWRIFVSQVLYSSLIVEPRDRYSIIPMGVDLATFGTENMATARKKLGLEQERKYVLFSSSFDRSVKNYPLAREAVEKIDGVELIELTGYTRTEVNLLMNACNVALMTSHYEGSPQFIKEAMACNRPIVSVDVGDVRDLFGKTNGCYICSYDPDDVSRTIRTALSFPEQTEGRKQISQLSGDRIANQIYEVYQKVVAGSTVS